MYTYIDMHICTHTVQVYNVTLLCHRLRMQQTFGVQSWFTADLGEHASVLNASQPPSERLQTEASFVPWVSLP
jgi:hypothetical protein